MNIVRCAPTIRIVKKERETTGPLRNAVASLSAQRFRRNRQRFPDFSQRVRAGLRPAVKAVDSHARCRSLGMTMTEDKEAARNDKTGNPFARNKRESLRSEWHSFLTAADSRVAALRRSSK